MTDEPPSHLHNNGASTFLLCSGPGLCEPTQRRDLTSSTEAAMAIQGRISAGKYPVRHTWMCFL